MAQSESEARREDEIPHLTIGYHAQQAERWPMNKSIANCYDKNSAYYFHLEQTHLKVRPEISFEALKDSIPPQHRDRIEETWLKLLKHEKDLTQNTTELRRCWENPPKNEDEKAKHLVQNSPVVLQDSSQAVAMALISTDPALTSWQVVEKSLRKSVHHATKDFMTILRVYLEELIEKQDEEYVLPKDHPERENIVIQNRYLQLLDATNMAMSTAKTLHHEQPGRRVRKTENKPVIFHPAAVTLEAIRHIVPFVIEADNLDINPMLVAIAAAVHDTSEDANVTVEEVITKLKEILDHYDSTINQAINSGFGLSRDKFKKKLLDMMNPTYTPKIRQALRILSTGEPLSDQEKKSAIEQNLAERQKTMRLLGITEKDLVRWGLQPTAETTGTQDTKLETFKQFDKGYDGGKIMKLIIKLHTITQSKITRQLVLMIKLTDRANNISTQGKMPFQYQKTNLRATVSRLLAYCMLDHDHIEMPLYNTLPNLLDETVAAYRRIKAENPEAMEEVDHELLAQAEKWQLEAIKLTVPQKVQAVLDQYEATKTTHP